MKTKKSPAVLIPLILLLFIVLFQVHLTHLEQTAQYQQVYRWQPWRHDLLEKSAQQSLQNGDLAAAIQYFEQARQQESLSLQGRQSLAEAYARANQPEKALREWENLLASGHPTRETLLNLAQAYHQRADFTREAEIARKGITLYPDVDEFHWRLALLKLAESPLEAEPFLEHLNALDPSPGYPLTSLIQTLNLAALAEDSPVYQLTISAQALAGLAEWPLAQSALERALALDPEYAPAWALLGETRQQTGSPGAFATLERALQLDPDSATTQAYIGLYWQRQSDFVRAEQAFVSAFHLDPQNPIWLINLADLAFQQADLPAANAYYQYATQVAPQDALPWRALALFCLRTEGCLRQDGLPAALKARSLAPEDWQNADLLGQVFMALGEDSSARALLNRAIQLAPTEPAPHFHLGLLYLRSGDIPAARQTLQKALSLDPNGPLAETIRSVIERYLP